MVLVSFFFTAGKFRRSQEWSALPLMVRLKNLFDFEDDIFAMFLMKFQVI